MAGAIAPYLYYEDGRAAVEWLCRAFGLSERMVMDGPDGPVTHAELGLGEGTIMLGEPGGGYRNPKNLWVFATAMSPAASGAEKAAEQTTP